MNNAITYEQLVEQLNMLMQRDYETDFMARLQSVWNRYKDFIAYGVTFSYYNDKTYKNEESTIFPNKLRPIIDDKCEKVREIVSAYLSGDIKRSIEVLEHDIIYDKALKYYLKYDYLRTDEPYYRLRSIDNTERSQKTCKYEPLDLFHMPFEYRGKVSTNRYSIPGYPCLYLGKSVYVCWEEMRRKDINAYAVVAMKCSKAIRLLDLRINRSFHTEADCKAYLTMLPIIIACGMQVNFDGDQFKPEYILPQLLLHTVLLNKQRMKSSSKDYNTSLSDIDKYQYKTYKGIIYSSSVIDHEYNITAGKQELTDCIVLPALVDENQSKGWSSELAQVMSISAPYVFPELEFLKDMDNYHSDILKSDAIRQDEKDKDKYKCSYFYAVEQLLQKSPFHDTTDLIKDREAKLTSRNDVKSI